MSRIVNCGTCYYRLGIEGARLKGRCKCGKSAEYGTITPTTWGCIHWAPKLDGILAILGWEVEMNLWEKKQETLVEEAMRKLKQDY